LSDAEAAVGENSPARGSGNVALSEPLADGNATVKRVLAVNDEEQMDRGSDGGPGGQDHSVLSAVFASDQILGGGENSQGRGPGSSPLSEPGVAAHVAVEVVLSSSDVVASLREAIAGPLGALGAVASARDAVAADLAANAGSGDRAGALAGADHAGPANGAGVAPVPNEGPQAAVSQSSALPGVNFGPAPWPGPGFLNYPASLATTDSSEFARFQDEEGAFLELWDHDQLLFPDSLPKMDEKLLPGGPRSGDEMPFPDESTKLDGPSQGGWIVEVPQVARAAGRAAETAPGLGASQKAAVAVVSAVDHGPDSARLSPLDAGPVIGQQPASEDPLRPYRIALGLLPFLPAFGFTPASLREKVRAGRRWWQDWRGGRRQRRN
jgi:hypothetical protein